MTTAPVTDRLLCVIRYERLTTLAASVRRWHARPLGASAWRLRPAHAGVAMLAVATPVGGIGTPARVAAGSSRISRSIGPVRVRVAAVVPDPPRSDHRVQISTLT